MFKLSVCEKVENEREIFRKQQEKAPMHLAPGLPDNFDKLESPYSTTRTIDFHMRIRTHACAMLEDHITITNNHEYKKDTSNIKFSQTIPINT